MEKRLFFLLIFPFAFGVCFGQGSILSIDVSPNNPSESDPVTISIPCMFNSGGCPQQSISSIQSGNTIAIEMHHCLGALAVICNHTGTVQLNSLNAGAYKVVARLLTGSGSTPCTPGIIHTDIDSVTFTVLPVLGLDEPNAGTDFAVSYMDGFVNLIHTGNNLQKAIKVLDVNGRIIYSGSLESGEKRFNLDLPAGLFLILLEREDGTILKRKMVAF